MRVAEGMMRTAATPNSVRAGTNSCTAPPAASPAARPSSSADTASVSTTRRGVRPISVNAAVARA